MGELNGGGKAIVARGLYRATVGGGRGWRYRWPLGPSRTHRRRGKSERCVRLN